MSNDSSGELNRKTSPKILLGHGSGGELMHELIAEYFASAFKMDQMGDAAVLSLPPDISRGISSGTYSGSLSFTTDSYVVSPLFFPGGNIGDLAVNGTINDLAMAGSVPLWLSAGFIIEEGFALNDLQTIVASMAKAAQNAGVKIVTGDTKVVDSGKGDGIFINTSGVGALFRGMSISAASITIGDLVIVSGEIGNHGICVMATRAGIEFEPSLLSDTRPLHDLVAKLADFSQHIHFMRDPTRGGLATTLKEAAKDSGTCIRIAQNEIPVAPQVTGACDMLGLDPLYIANEGIMVAIVARNEANAILSVMQNHPAAPGARIIGEVAQAPKGMVLLETAIGGTRVLEMLQGEQLPRIC